ncbi:MAG: AbrB/MazE/SpoVT family DNA-binding domain-containing protein [Candidatus Methylomirabilales bacterium]
MAAVRIGPKHQVTIPKEVFEALSLEVGDFLDAEAEAGRIVLTPKRLAAKVPAPRLSPAEQKILTRAKAKIERIQRDLLHANGLTREEARVAAKAGLIDPEQIYWWTEEWQKGERAAERDVRAGRIRSFSSAEELISNLRR